MSTERLIKALPTYYGGVRFKSALEARWAMYFDEINVAWRYEDEGYALPSGPYLPDFWLPVAGMHAEVKPDSGFSLIEVTRCRELSAMTGFPAILLDGPPRSTSFYLVRQIQWNETIIEDDEDGGYWTNGESEGMCETIAVGTNKQRLQNGEGYWVEKYYEDLPFGTMWRHMRPSLTDLCFEEAHETVRCARRTLDGRLVPA
jgi:hypothetical protein